MRGTSKAPGLPLASLVLRSMGLVSLSFFNQAKEAQSSESVFPVPVGLSNKAFSPLFNARMTLVM